MWGEVSGLGSVPARAVTWELEKITGMGSPLGCPSFRVALVGGDWRVVQVLSPGMVTTESGLRVASCRRPFVYMQLSLGPPENS